MLAAVALALLAGCSAGSPGATVDPSAAASSPLAGVTLPPDPLVDQVLRPDEVPAGMVPILKGSGPRTVDVVAGYSGSGATKAAAQARLQAHHFVSAYVAQYANLSTGQVLSVLASRFAAPADATADFADDLKGNTGKTVATPVIGEQSAVTVQPLPGKPASQLVLVRFRRGTTTWSLAYKASPTADPEIAINLATALLARTST